MEIFKANILKSYSAIDVHRQKWNEVISSVEASLKTLLSLSDQLECVLKIQPCELSRTFPYLKDKLEQIIRALMEEEIFSISHSLEELSQLNIKLRSNLDVSYKSYLEDHAIIQTNTGFYHGTSLHPPLSEMIEWLDDINICYATMLTTTKHMLEIVDFTPQSLMNLQNTLDSRRIISPVEGIMAKMATFIQEK